MMGGINSLVFGIVLSVLSLAIALALPTLNTSMTTGTIELFQIVFILLAAVAPLLALLERD